MSLDIVTFAVIVALVVYVPLAAALLYTWWRYGKGDRAVSVARAIFLIGSVLLIAYMIFI